LADISHSVAVVVSITWSSGSAAESCLGSLGIGAAVACSITVVVHITWTLCISTKRVCWQLDIGATIPHSIAVVIRITGALGFATQDAGVCLVVEAIVSLSITVVGYIARALGISTKRVCWQLGIGTTIPNTVAVVRHIAQTIGSSAQERASGFSICWTGAVHSRTKLLGIANTHRYATGGPGNLEATILTADSTITILSHVDNAVAATLLTTAGRAAGRSSVAVQVGTGRSALETHRVLRDKLILWAVLACSIAYFFKITRTSFQTTKISSREEVFRARISDSIAGLSHITHSSRGSTLGTALEISRAVISNTIAGLGHIADSSCRSAFGSRFRIIWTVVVHSIARLRSITVTSSCSTLGAIGFPGISRPVIADSVEGLCHITQSS